ncbi:MAG TPA: ferredoxin [Myxococcales bacterium]|nr:ferredoxin [Deltaproteobacteria bacterium]MBU51252.1 ferredoxin [Deltaproteobacteria bacterium]HAA55982.1 ferredoxin [Myxococcales bacterium]|tara:strand:- start:183 stop:524 length:342 start_codon:yes stop_codon:yes gene_type:complete
MPEWIFYANSSDLAEGGSLCRKFEDEEIAVFRVEGNVYAIENQCPHMGAPLSEGTLEGTTVLCPWHNARFNLHVGSVTSKINCRAALIYTIREVDGVIELEWPPKRRRPRNSH